MSPTAAPVFLIEDNEHDLFSLQQQVKHIADLSGPVHAFRCLNDALQYNGEHAPGLIICDLNLPDSAGLETVTALQRQFSSTPLIVLSGMGDQTIALRAIEEGAQDYLVKGDFNLEMLTRSVRYSIGRMLVIQDLEAERDRAEKSERVMQEFLTNVSHEMRTPMNVVSGMSHLLYDTGLTKEQLELVRGIRVAADNLLVLVSDLLDLSKVERGQLELHPVPIDLVEVVTDLCNGVELLAQQKGLRFSLHISEAVPRHVLVDANRLRQILLNVLNNAIKFTEFGSVELRVDRKGNELALLVSDTGPGISAATLPHIFERFHRGDAELAKRHAGTGVGLSLVQQLVTCFGGQIDVDSTPGEGTTFEIRLPVEETSNAAVVASSKASEGQFSLDGFEVLVAEDYLLNQKVICQWLKRCGATVHSVLDGTEAVAFVKHRVPDAILMDVRMPNLNGIQATRAIRSLESAKAQTVPIVALTANALPHEKERCLDAGMNAYHSKPIDFTELGALLCALLGNNNEVHAGAAELQQEVEQVEGSMFDQLRNLFEADTELIVEVADEFVRRVPGEMEDLDQALTKEHVDAAVSLAHKLCNPMAIVGMNQISSTMSEIEQLLLNNDIYAAQGLFNTAKSLFQDSIIRLKTELQLLKTATL